MAANIEQRDGRYSFWGMDPAWHELGMVTGRTANGVEALTNANINWRVDKEQMRNPLTGDPIPWYAVIRDVDREVMGIVGRDYGCVQNSDMVEYVDAVLEADGNAHYVAAGALGRGERVWVLARINGQIEPVPGDTIETYLLFTTSHDGSLAATCKVTTVRVVCANTLSMALADNRAYVRITHTKNVQDRLAAARELISGAGQTIADIETKLHTLAQRLVTPEMAVSVLTKLYGDFQATTDNGKLKNPRAANVATEVAKLAAYNDGGRFPEVKGTAYGLLNAITEYTDHLSVVRRTEGRAQMSEAAIRAENSLFGNGDGFKTRALELVLAETAQAERKPDPPKHFHMPTPQPDEHKPEQTPRPTWTNGDGPGRPDFVPPPAIDTQSRFIRDANGAFIRNPHYRGF